MSRGILGGKQVIKFAKTSNRVWVSLLSQNKSRAKCTVRVSTRCTFLFLSGGYFRSLLHLKAWQIIISTHNLLLSSFIKSSHLSGVYRIYKLERDFVHWQTVITCLPTEKSYDISYIPSSVLQRVQGWRVSWIRSITIRFVLVSNQRSTSWCTSERVTPRN